MRKGEHRRMLWKRLNKATQSLAHSKVGLQIPCCFYSAKGGGRLIWTSPAPFREDFSCLGPADKVSDFGRAFASGSCSYVYRDSPKHPVASVIGFLKGKSAVAVVDSLA